MQVSGEGGTALLNDAAHVDYAWLTRGVALLRCAVGAVLLVRPDVATSRDAQRRILVRTIGLRDCVAGAGTLRAMGGATSAKTWIAAGLANDLGDIALALAARRELGFRGALLAAITPLPFVLAGLAGLAGGSQEV